VPAGNPELFPGPLSPAPAFLIQADGSSRNNPGPAGIGVCVLDAAGKVLAEIAKSIGERTNNQAEYAALLEALEHAAPLDGPVVVQTDSELLYHQLSGRYKVRDPDLKPLVAEAKSRLARLPHVRLKLVRREENKRADKLAQSASAKALVHGE